MWYKNETLTKLLKKIWIVFAILIILAAILSSLVRALTPWAKQYKASLEQSLSLFLNKPVHITNMETGWYWFEPVVKLQNVTVSKGKGEAITLAKLFVGIDLVSSLLHWQIQPGILYIEGVKLSIEQKDNHWHIKGLDNFVPQSMPLDAKAYQPILAWILGQQKIIITQMSADITLQDHTKLPINKLNLLIVKNALRYRVKGEAYIWQTFFQVAADLELDPLAPHHNKGQLYLSALRFNPLQWQKFFPKSRWVLEQGQGNIALWLDIYKSTIDKIQSRLHLSDVLVKDTASQKKYKLPLLDANVAFLQSKKAWELSADKLRVSINGTPWPENAFKLKYQKNEQKYTLFVKHLLIKPLFSYLQGLPDNWHGIKTSEVFGELRDTHIGFSPDFRLDFFTSRFSKLGWKGEADIPGVHNLSGSLDWQPTEGLLEIESNDLSIIRKNEPTLSFSSWNSLLGWKVLSHGLRLNLDNLVVEHSNFTLSSHGVFDEVTKDSLGPVNLVSQISGTKVEHLLAFAPKPFLKEKLGLWLTENIKHLEAFSAEVTVNGLWREFRMKGHLKGLDFHFAPNWPLINDFEGVFQVDKRKLDVDVLHAIVQDTPIHQGNFQIENVGFGTETLLLHTSLDAYAENVIKFIAASPLEKKLALPALQASGDLKLNLQLEVPLYQGNNTLLALGDIAFQNNKLNFKDLEVNNLQGLLQFDNKGILAGSLRGLIKDDPLLVEVHSQQEPAPSRLITVKGKAAIDTLQQLFPVPLFAVMRGNMALDSTIVLPESPEGIKKISLRSSLQGAAIHLPPPFDKVKENDAPLALDMEFHPDKTYRVEFSYDKHIHADVWLSKPKDKVIVDKGEVRIGEGDFPKKSSKGVQISGSLSDFNLGAWREVLEKIPLSEYAKRFLQAVTAIDVELKKAEIGNQHYPMMRIKGEDLSPNLWSFKVLQQNMDAALQYHWKTNTISGNFSKLHLQKSGVENETRGHPVHAKDMPNLNVDISDLHYADWDIGKVNVITHSRDKNWYLDAGSVITPFYEIQAKGVWEEEGGNSKSSMEATMSIRNLADTLRFWRMSPVVEANYGSLHFQGSWPGSFQDFSLKHVSGQLAITLKKGRISSLDKATEGKIGLGKLLSILSLQTIPRRLMLDFSDLSSKGYSFDIFKGSFIVNNGLMHTEDSYINGPVAYASMKGSLDIARQLYDMTLKVSPHVTASLPVVATIAGGPVAGIATWVVSKIINKGMQKVTGYTYKISGPWKQPVVQQIKIFKQ